MDAYGQLCQEAALDKKGQAIGKGLEFMRSRPLNSIHIDVPFQHNITIVTEVETNSGFLSFRQDSEDQVIRTSRNFCPKFKGYTLERVDNNENGVPFSIGEDFYPLLHTMLKTKCDWTTGLHFRGRATFEIGVMEWTEFVLENFGNILDQAEIYGAVGVSRYPYHGCENVWKAFLELWSPLTNTLHHGNGEMSISLYDVRVIGGLPISGIPYEEFIPENKELRDDGPYSTTLAELLCIYSQLCVSNNLKFVRWEEWVRHFYRGQLLYMAYGDDMQQLTNAQRERFMRPRPPLEISREGELAAFLAYWLSRFVLPSHCYVIRPETFHMACLMAQGKKVSLAPTVLGHIYHGLGEIVTDPRGPGVSRGCFPVHYVIGWLGEHFNCLYKRHADSEFPLNYPFLIRYAGIKAQDLDITSARLVFRTRDYVEYRPSPFLEDNGYFLIDSGNLPGEEFEFLVCIRPTLLPVRIGVDLWSEPYYPNRFARQFGFDQGVPVNETFLKFEKRKRCGVETLAQAQQMLLKAGTGTRFYILRSSYEGTCTWTYCRWWMAACAPYLGRSVSYVYLTLKKEPLVKQNNIFVIKSLREISSAMRKEAFFPDLGEEDQTVHFENNSPARGGDENVNRKACSSKSCDFSESGSAKRARHERYDTNDEVSGNNAYYPDDHSFHQNITKDVQNVINSRLQSIVVYNPSLEPQSSCSMNSTSELRHEASRVQPLIEIEPVIKGSEQRSAMMDPQEQEFAVDPKDHFESASGGTEPIDSEDVDEGISQYAGASSALYESFGACSNRRAVDFIITEVEVILEKLTSSRSPQAILNCQGEVSESIDLITTMLEKLGPGKDKLEPFSAKVAQAFDMASQLSQDMGIIETGSTLNIEHIRKLIQSHEECKAVKKSLNLELSNLEQELRGLKATEDHIIEVEKKAKKLRKDYEAAKDHLEKKIDESQTYLEQQTKLDEELQHARTEVNEAKLAEFDKFKSTLSRRQEELEQLLDSLSTFGKQHE